MKFYEQLEDAIKQIISETYSYKTPISVNLSDEMYNYFNMFSLLNKADLKKAIETEFESYCFEKNINKNAFESRYALVNNIEDKDKIKVIHVSAGKANLSKITQYMQEYKLSTITPIGMSIPNIANIKPKENILVYIISIVCMMYFLKEQSIKKNIIIIYMNMILFSIVFVYNCLRNTTLNILGLSEESVELLYDLAEKIFQDISKFFMIYFAISTVLILKKYSRYIYFLVLLFFIYVARNYHIYVRIPEDIYLIGFFLCYTVITFCVINIFQNKSKNKLIISLMTVLYWYL